MVSHFSRSRGTQVIGLTAMFCLLNSADVFAQQEWTASNLLISTTATGININDFIGADRFYRAGYTGARTVITNIEAGHLWGGDPANPTTGHETLQHSTVRLNTDPLLYPGGQVGEVDQHATWVGSALAGRPAGSNPREQQRGIAYGATLWSGAIATSWIPNSNPATYRLSFTISSDSLTQPYIQAMQTGVNGRRTDVVNSSWGDSSSPSGFNAETAMIDALAKNNRTTVVFAAGNAGAAGNNVGSPGAGYNSIVVGALGNADNYNTVASFSSRGPLDYTGPDPNNPSGPPEVVRRVRARVDLVAPGTSLSLASYGGKSGGNIGTTNPNTDPTRFTSVQGTSFASPIVAGGASLLADVGYDRYGGGDSVDGNVIKAVLMNSATKISGWNNNQAVSGGVLTTTQALDFASGAGAINLDRAFDQYTAGTANAGGTGTSLVEAIGWDYGGVGENAFTDYFFDRPLVGGTNFTATLNWFVGRSFVGLDGSGNLLASDDFFTDLNLELWNLSGGLPSTLIAQSATLYNNTEHFTFDLPSTDNYMLRVRWAGERYDLVNNSFQNFGLAWWGTAAAAPEPGSLLLAALVCWGLYLLGRLSARSRYRAEEVGRLPSA